MFSYAFSATINIFFVPLSTGVQVKNPKRWFEICKIAEKFD